MRSIFQNDAAFAPMDECIKWRQDKSPHLEGAFYGTVLHGESQSESAGPSRSGIAADSWTVIIREHTATCAGMKTGDTLELLDGTVLSIQQVTKDAAFGWVVKATANARAPR